MPSNRSIIPSRHVFSPSRSGEQAIDLKSHLRFTAGSLLVLMGLYSLLRVALLVYNREQTGGATAAVLAEAFFNGLRFDLRLAVWACLP